MSALNKKSFLTYLKEGGIYVVPGQPGRGILRLAALIQLE
jgi:ABC-type glucose/galactose transport system permease subunit